jgi:hypothetical protein
MIRSFAYTLRRLRVIFSGHGQAAAPTPPMTLGNKCADEPG